jgi:hypothetical protein
MAGPRKKGGARVRRGQYRSDKAWTTKAEMRKST